MRAHLGAKRAPVTGAPSDPKRGTRPATLVTAPRRLDLKALRRAVHGWWLGNPLVYKPGSADLAAVARELAEAGAASGTLVLDDLCEPPEHERQRTSQPEGHDEVTSDAVRAILLVRPPLPQALVGMATAQALADVATSTLDRPCVIRGRWQVILRDEDHEDIILSQIGVQEHADVALVELIIALGQLRLKARIDDDQPATALLARPDWREVFLARVLHTLDVQLGVLSGSA